MAPMHSVSLPPGKGKRTAAAREQEPAFPVRKPRRQPHRPAPKRDTFLSACQNGFGFPRSHLEIIIFVEATLHPFRSRRFLKRRTSIARLPFC
jgi:hypothetical protein